MRSLSIHTALILIVCCPATGADGQPQYMFEADVAPILKSYCWKCHGGGGLAGGLDLRRVDFIVQGGKSGPALVARDPAASLLYQKLLKGLMPPATTTEQNVVYAPIKTNADQQEVIRRWIEQGARSEWAPRSPDETEDPQISTEDRSWWAFVPPVQSLLPTIRGGNAGTTPVDLFLLKALEENGLGYARPADDRTLFTRLHFDLTGLPPSPERLDRYLNDRRPDRYQTHVKKLLADPGFGRHWGQYWLDAAGYSDVTGSDNDGAIIKLHDGKWRYRDYVVEALNGNMPYDQFLREQLAGDELSSWREADSYTETMRRQLIATGFLRQAADTSGEKELNTPDIRNRVLLDTVQMVSSSVMGVTLHCAQCHSHKFDPLSQADYYRFVSIFSPALDPRDWKHPGTRHLWSVPETERQLIDDENARLKNEIATGSKRLSEEIQLAQRRIVRDRLAALPLTLQQDLRIAVGLPKEKRTAVQGYLATKLGPLLVVEDLDHETTAAEKMKLAEIRKTLASKNGSLRSYYRIQALWETVPAKPFHLFRQGAYDQPGPEVAAAFPRVALTAGTAGTIPSPERSAASSGRRSALARWLTSKSNPLTARVYVNRIWQRYFGVGIVATPDNFGRSGGPPSNQALLDWLARDFIDNGFDVKRLHEAIVLSAAYRQSSATADVTNIERAERLDPENRLLWRMSLRRLEAGAIRDRILATGGKLNLRAGGPPVELLPQPNGYVIIDRKKLARPEDQYRLSIYVLARRNYHLTQLNVFDQPVLAHNCTRRNSSAGVSQSLLMLNSEFCLTQAGHFSQRVLREAATRAPASLVRHAFQVALCRQPEAAELQWAIAFLSKGTKGKAEGALESSLAQFCHVLLNTNEFLYIP